MEVTIFYFSTYYNYRLIQYLYTLTKNHVELRRKDVPLLPFYHLSCKTRALKNIVPAKSPRALFATALPSWDIILHIALRLVPEDSSRRSATTALLSSLVQKSCLKTSYRPKAPVLRSPRHSLPENYPAHPFASHREDVPLLLSYHLSCKTRALKTLYQPKAPNTKSFSNG